MLAGCRSDLSFIARDDSDWDRLMLHPNLETTPHSQNTNEKRHKDVSVRDRTTVWCVGSHLRAPAPAETSYLPTSYPAEPSGAPQTSSTQILRAHRRPISSHKSICGPHIDMHIAHAATRVRSTVMTGRVSPLRSRESRWCPSKISIFRCLSLKCCIRCRFPHKSSQAKGL